MKLLYALLPTLASALPGGGPPSRTCLSDSQATCIVNAYAATFQINGSDTAAFNAASEAIESPNYTYISDSTSFLAELPLGVPIYTDLSHWEANHTFDRPIYQETTLGIWHTCDVITWWWEWVLYPGAKPVRGIGIFMIENGLIDELILEFNSAVWGLDLGWTVTPPPGVSSGGGSPGGPPGSGGGT